MVMGLIGIIFVLFNALLYMLPNEIIQANIAMRNEVVNHLLESAVEEASMIVRSEMNYHDGQHIGTFYGYFRAGKENSAQAPDIDCPVTKEMASNFYGIPEDDITVTAAFINIKNFEEDMMGEKRNVPNGTKSVYGTLRITAEISYGTLHTGQKYTRKIVVTKDIKVVRVLPPYPDFALVVRDGGHAGANYNQWRSYHGGEKLNFSVCAGDNADANKNGKILFGGGLSEKELINMIPGSYPKTDKSVSAWMTGWIPSPNISQMKSMGLKQWPIIMNLTNYGRNNVEVQHLYEDKIQSIPEYYGMTPTSDFHAFGSEKQNLGAMVSALPTQKLPYKIPVVKNTGQGQNQKTKTDEVELTFFRATLGYGQELAGKPEKIKPTGMFSEKSEGFRNYFGFYDNTYPYNETDPYNSDKTSIFNVQGSGIDLYGSDPTDGRDHNKRPNRNTIVYVNIMGSYVTAHVLKLDKNSGNKTDAKAACLPWLPFDNQNDLGLLMGNPLGGKLPEEFKRSLGGSVLNKFKNLIKLDLKKVAASGYPHCGKEENTDYKVPVPEPLLEPWNGDGMNSIYYRQFMSSPKYFPLDQGAFGQSQQTQTMVFRHEYVSPISGASLEASQFNEYIHPELFELSPDMASYKFVGPMEFVLYLKKLGLLSQDEKTGEWQLILDGIWFVQGLISDFNYRTLLLPPASYENQPAGAMNVYGKGLIATVEGTPITVGGVAEGDGTQAGGDPGTQLSVVVAPTRILQNLINIFRTNPDLIPTGMNLSGNIEVTDQPIQASLCAPMGSIKYRDDPNWDRERAVSAFNHDNAPFNKFLITGNLILNRLSQKEMEDTYNPGTGGGVVRYDPHLIQSSHGQTNNKNYHVSFGQRYSYYSTSRVDPDEKGGRAN